MNTSMKLRNLGLSVVGAALLVLVSSSFSTASAATVIKKAGPDIVVRHAPAPVAKRHAPVMVAKHPHLVPAKKHVTVSFGISLGHGGVTFALAPVKPRIYKKPHLHRHRTHTYCR